jgi:hypothetical protein
MRLVSPIGKEQPHGVRDRVLLALIPNRVAIAAMGPAAGVVPKSGVSAKTPTRSV